MKLYFLRHATASDVASSDAGRELTGHGENEARIAGAALHKLGVEPGHIFTSPLLRARQTAEIAAEAMKVTGRVAVLDELTIGRPTVELLRALKSADGAAEIVLVGHMPSLSEHVAALIGAKSATGLPLGKGAVACVAIEQLRAGGGELRWLMRQKQLEKIAK